MKKKTYIVPTASAIHIATEQVICTSKTTGEIPNGETEETEAPDPDESGSIFGD